MEAMDNTYLEGTLVLYAAILFEGIVQPATMRAMGYVWAIEAVLVCKGLPCVEDAGSGIDESAGEPKSSRSVE